MKTGSPATSMANGMGLLPEDRTADGIIPTMSVKENITLSADQSFNRWGFVSNAKVSALAERFIDRLQIEVADMNQSAATLSGGNQREVLLARLLAIDPVVVLRTNRLAGSTLAPRERFSV